MAGSISVTSDNLVSMGYGERYMVRKIVIDWTGDASDGTVPALSLVNLHGYVLKAITNPGATAPTANYDIALGDPEDSSLDALASALANRSASATEQVYPTASGATIPIWLDKGDYSLSVSGNSVNSATGRIILYLADEA